MQTSSEDNNDYSEHITYSNTLGWFYNFIIMVLDLSHTVVCNSIGFDNSEDPSW